MKDLWIFGVLLAFFIGGWSLKWIWATRECVFTDQGSECDFAIAILFVAVPVLAFAVLLGWLMVLGYNHFNPVSSEDGDEGQDSERTAYEAALLAWKAWQTEESRGADYDFEQCISLRGEWYRLRDEYVKLSTKPWRFKLESTKPSKKPRGRGALRYRS